MIKKVLTTLNVLVSGISFAQPVADMNSSADESDHSYLIEAEIKASCGHLIPGGSDYNECVSIVTMDFTVVPHNQGGTGHCPGGCKSEESDQQQI